LELFKAGMELLLAQQLLQAIPCVADDSLE